MKRLLVVTWTAYPPTTGTAIILASLLKEFDPQRTILVGERTFGTGVNEFKTTPYRFIPLEHPFQTGIRGSRYLRWLVFNRIRRRISAIIKEYDIEVVLAVFPDEFYVFAALLSARQNKVSFYSWFHNTYLDNRRGVLQWLARWIQPKIFRYSSRIFTMSEGMNYFMQEQYPMFAKKMFALHHGFEIPENSSLKQGELKISYPTKFLLTGNINHSNLEATVRLIEALLSMTEPIEIHSYGNFDHKDWELNGIRDNRLFAHSFVPLQQLQEKFADFDIMLLPHGFSGNLSEAEYRTIFPTRVIPLLYSRKPILAHVPKGTSLHQMLRKKGCAKIIDIASSKAIISATRSLMINSQEREDLVEAALLAAKDYDAKKVASYFLQSLEP